MMKPRLLDWLACPNCGDGLVLDCEISSQTEEVESGVIRCPGCAEEYPIVEGIPRIYPGAATDFRQPRAGSYGGSNFRRTARAYSNWWQKVQQDEEYRDSPEVRLKARTGLTCGDIKGQVVLDAGCGNGSLSEALLRWQAHEVVALDLSKGVDVARRTLGHHANIHFVQGNLLFPPFKPGVFDRVISIGVLHHTPRPKDAYLKVAELVKPGGSFSVYLYHRPGRTYTDAGSLTRAVADLRHVFFQAPLHRLLSIMPHPIIRSWAYFMACWQMALYKLQNSGRAGVLLGLPLWLLNPGGIYFPSEPFGLAVVRNYDLYASPFNFTVTLEEVIDWAREAGLNDLTITPFPLSITGCKTGKPTDPLCLSWFSPRPWQERFSYADEEVKS